MSTTITTRDDQVVGVRFWGGREAGRVVQLEITEAEMPAWAAVPVAEESSTAYVALVDWLAAQDATIRFDTAARRNQAARDLENHRWALQDGTSVSGLLRGAASDLRRRARDCARQQLRAT